jgi:hypothetical protein
MVGERDDDGGGSGKNTNKLVSFVLSPIIPHQLPNRSSAFFEESLSTSSPPRHKRTFVPEAALEASSHSKWR